MVPETHRIIAGEQSKFLKLEFGLHLNETKLLRGSIAPDIYPKYKFIPHYYEESIDYIVENIVRLIPYMSEIFHQHTYSGLLNHGISYKIGVISHYLADYMTHPHARRIRCTSMKDMWEHMSYERELNHYVKQHSIDTKETWGQIQTSRSNDDEDLRAFIKNKISTLVDEYLEKDIAYHTDAQSAYLIGVSVFYTVCEAAYQYGLEKQLQTA